MTTTVVQKRLGSRRGLRRLRNTKIGTISFAQRQDYKMYSVTQVIRNAYYIVGNQYRTSRDVNARQVPIKPSRVRINIRQTATIPDLPAVYFLIVISVYHRCLAQNTIGYPSWSNPCTAVIGGELVNRYPIISVGQIKFNYCASANASNCDCIFCGLP